MRKLIILLLLVIQAILRVNAQSTKVPAVSVSQAEYFFDHDPGVGKGTSLSLTAVTADSASITASISTSGLSAGFHVLYVRTLDNDGRWGLFRGRPFIISNPAPAITPVNAAEYFFDKDPGVGKGTAFSGTASSTDSIVINTTVPTASLSAGFHVMYVRARDANGRWGDFVGRLFIINTSIPAPAPVASAEYFFDKDPGVGKGTAITGTAKGDSLIITATIPTSSLSAGLHVMYVRAKGSDGKWGLFVGRLFIINPATPSVVSVAAAEYFFDKDPGVGKGTPITGFTAQGDSLVANSSISSNGLSVGIHVLYMRAKDSNGRWGLFVGRLFIVNPATSNTVSVTGAEYFFDKDPGVGKGTPISGTSNGDSLEITNASIAIASLNQGIHVMYVRAKDSNGKWGLFKAGLFVISTPGGNPQIVSMEYFFDNANPADGKGTPIVLPAPGDSVSVTTALSAAGLAVGNHTVSVRAEDNTGKWSLLDTKSFLISNCAQPLIAPFTTSSQNITTSSATAYTADTNICASGTITLTAPSGYSSYNWINNTTKQSIGTSQSITVSPGSYKVIFPVLNACPADTATLNISGAPTVTVKPGTNSMADTLVSSSSTGNQWYLNGVAIPGATNQTYIATTSGNYTVLVISSCYPSPGVSSTPAVKVSLPASTTACAQPLISPFGTASSVLDTAICTTATVKLTAPLGYASYNWINNLNNQSVGNTQTVTLPAGSYSLILPATTSCKADTVTINLSDIPAVTVKPGKLTTSGDTLISSSPTGNQWYLNGSPITGATGQKYLATVSGNYNVVVKNSCYPQVGGASSVVVPIIVPICNPPLIAPFTTAAVKLDTAICSSATLALTAPSGGSYNWVNNTSSQSIGTNQSVTVGPGSYSLQVTATSSCPADTVSISVSGAPSVTSKLGSNSTSDTLTSSSSTGNQWYLNGNAIAGATSQVYVATVSGSYFVTVINSCYPSPGASSAAIGVTVKTVTCTPPLIAPFAVAAAKLDTTVCSGSTISFTAPVGYTAYNWIDNSTSQSIGTNQSITVGSGSYSLQLPLTSKCPADTVTILVKTAATIAANFTGLDTSYCTNSPTATLTGTPTGGLFSAIGAPTGTISGNTFNPSVAGAGTYQIIYKYTNANNCLFIDTLKTTVHTLTSVSVSGLNSVYCANALTDTLTGSPSGGAFSGTGIIGDSLFSPSLAGAGATTITYTYIDNNRCTNTATVSTTVYALPVASYTGLNSYYCIKSTSFALLTGHPTGGTFSGDTSLILPNLFYPSDAGVGTHKITYTYTDAHSCTNSSTDSTVIYIKPSISVTGLDSSYCLNSATAILTGTHPSEGGTASFSGTGIVQGSNDTTFSASVAGLGSHTIIYSYTDSAGCFNKDTLTTLVHNPPAVSVSGLASSYCANADSVHLSGNPYGGAFSSAVVGVVSSDSTFHPSLVNAAGSYSIIYTYTDVFHCSTSDTAVTAIKVVPSPSILGAKKEYCSQETANQIGGYPRGGTLTVSGGNYTALTSDSGSFSPTITAGLDSTTGLITYSYIDATSGCSNTDTFNLTIYSKPVVIFSSIPLCYNTTAPLAGVAHPSGGLFTFSGNGTNNNQFYASSVNTGTYSLQYTYTVATCSTSGSTSVEVYKPTVQLTGIQTPYCFNDNSSILQVSPAGGALTYSGSAFTDLGNGQIAFYPSQADAIDSLAYTYTDANACSVTVHQTINVYPYPAKPVIGSAPDTICANDTLNLTATDNSSGVSYIWSDPNGNTYAQQSVSFTNTDATGIYSITVSNSNGCTNSDSVFIVVKSAPAFILQPYATDTLVCDFNKASVYIVTESDFSYYNWYWNGIKISGQHDSILYISTIGKYMVAVVDTDNCVAYSSPITISGNAQTPTITVTGAPLDSILTSSSASGGYQWYVNNKRIIGETDQTLNVYYNGTYSVLASYGTNGCKEFSEPYTVNRYDFININRISSQTDSTITIPQTSKSASSNIVIKYDQLSKNYYVEYTPVQDELLTITITAMTGEILWKSDVKAEKWVLSSTAVNVSNLASAMYILNVSTVDQSAYKKIIVD